MNYPGNWILLVLDLKKKVTAPTQLCVTTLEANNWNLDEAERDLRIKGYGGHS